MSGTLNFFFTHEFLLIFSLPSEFRLRASVENNVQLDESLGATVPFVLTHSVAGCGLGASSFSRLIMFSPQLESQCFLKAHVFSVHSI